MLPRFVNILGLAVKPVPPLAIGKVPLVILLASIFGISEAASVPKAQAFAAVFFNHPDVPDNSSIAFKSSASVKSLSGTSPYIVPVTRRSPVIIESFNCAIGQHLLYFSIKIFAQAAFSLSLKEA